MHSRLLETKNNEKNLKEFLNTQSKRAIIKYRNLMKTFMQADAGMRVKGASPNQKYFDVALSASDIIDNQKILDGEISDMVITETIFGEIVGINVKKKTFAFTSVEGDHITGKLCNDFIDTVFEVPKYVEIVVEQRLNINDITKEEKYSYTLLELKEIITNT